MTIALAAAGCTWAEVIHIYTFTTDMDSYLAAERDIARPTWVTTRLRQPWSR